jgi:ABC-type transporter Mla maintaining outer membrane lipid asymmetry ATPase subunit MlaF
MNFNEKIWGMKRQDNDDGSAAFAVEVRGLRMRYGTTDVLRGVDFAVRQGEIVSLLGRNGAGKTTTIRRRGPCSGCRPGQRR